MIVTTTHSIDNQPVQEYLGIVMGRRGGMLMVTSAGTAVKSS